MKIELKEITEKDGSTWFLVEAAEINLRKWFAYLPFNREDALKKATDFYNQLKNGEIKFGETVLLTDEI